MTVSDEIQGIAEAIVDGTASEADRERLAVLLADSPASREVWADLEAARSALAPAGLESPPPSLHDSILGAAAASPRPRPTLSAGWQAIVSSLTLRPASRLAWGLAALLAVTILGVAAITGQFGAGRDLGPSSIATLSPEGGSDATPAPGPDAEPPATPAPEPVAPEPRIEVKAVRHATTVTVRVEALGDGARDVRFTWNADRALLTGFRWIGGDGDAPTLEPGRVLTRVSGGASFEFALSNSGRLDPDLQLLLRSGKREEVRRVSISAR